MIRALPRFAGVLSLFGVVGLASLVACSEEGTQTPAPSPAADASPHTATPAPEGMEALGEFEAHFDAKSGALTFRPLNDLAKANPVDGAVGLPGATPQGFAPVGSGTMDVTTEDATVGPTPLFTGGACAANRLCARVRVTNTAAGRQVNTVYVQVTSASPAGFVGANSSAIPTGYPLSNALGLWSYNDLVPGASNVVRWEFALPTTADFTFNVALFGTFLRSDYGGSATTILAAANTLDNSGSFRNACSSAGGMTPIAGSPFLTSAGPGADNSGAEIALPFPFSLYDVTFDTDTNPFLIVNTNGAIGFLPIGNDSNVDLPDSSSNYDYSMFPFWDNIKTGPSGICAATEGTAPNRSFVLTWKDASINGVGGDLTFSVVMKEQTDRIAFQYNRWSTSTSNCASTSPGALRGSSATVGVQGGGPVATKYSFNAAFLPAHNATCPGAGYEVAFGASPINPTP
jgi:hypothetical protein